MRGHSYNQNRQALHFARTHAGEQKYLGLVKTWDLQASPGSKGQTVFQCWWDSLESGIWRDELEQIKPLAPWPEEQTTMEWLKKDSAMPYIDNILTTEKETLFDIVTVAFKKSLCESKRKR